MLYLKIILSYGVFKQIEAVIIGEKFCYLYYHKMKEVLEVADRIIVMQNGRLTGDISVKDTNEVELARLMMGKNTVLPKREQTKEKKEKKVCLELSCVTVQRKGEFPLLNNLSLVLHGFLNKKKLHNDTQRAIEEFDIKAPGPEARMKGLSGGNQQKVILAREVGNAGKVLIMNQPARGLDLGAIHNIHNNILAERNKGKAILLVSTELSEIFRLCDRISVIYKGSFMGIYDLGGGSCFPNELFIALPYLLTIILTVSRRNFNVPARLGVAYSKEN